MNGIQASTDSKSVPDNSLCATSASLPAGLQHDYTRLPARYYPSNYIDILAAESVLQDKLARFPVEFF